MNATINDVRYFHKCLDEKCGIKDADIETLRADVPIYNGMNLHELFTSCDYDLVGHIQEII